MRERAAPEPHISPPASAFPAAVITPHPIREGTMSAVEEYDLVVLGSGAPGKLLAWTLASQGKHVAVIERRYIGGACPNIACLPSKNVIHSAKVASYFRRGAE